MSSRNQQILGAILLILVVLGEPFISQYLFSG